MNKRGNRMMRLAAGTEKIGNASVRSSVQTRPVSRQARHDLARSDRNVPSGRMAEDQSAWWASMRTRQLIGGASTKRSKYRNTRCEWGGIKFDSLKERARWIELVDKLARGEISDLQRQVPFVLAEAALVDGKRKRARAYIADFVYISSSGRRVVEDVKGFRTTVYELKKHLMKTVHNVEIVEVT
ncbi:DUF1064 domain-containing protein [Paraburkholderia sp. Tr-20389]|uniref:DUF1064 domain-containing protein n=1 Tax=Paraburkholderia sp. Tr-20389 TaxID=2703903 RepID=UPI001F11F5FE|nr:DUF1064 domain-containing protein [Paraburkholderia sp. Tr-20389]